METKAISYGELELIPGIRCDCYMLEGDRAVMSENGVAAMLGVNQMLLNRIKTNWPKKTLEPFCDKGLTIATTLVFVEAEKSPYKGQSIVAYDSATIEGIILAYSRAYAHDALRENQVHIGKHASRLISVLVKTSLQTLIEEACGQKPAVQATARRFYRDAIFASVNDLLYRALRIPYPGREAKKYQGLMATCFKYAYEQYLGKDAYKKIKEDRLKCYPVHQYISDETTRRKCFCYMALLANYIALHECRIAEAKEPVKALVDRLVEARMPGLTRSGKQGRQMVFDFGENADSCLAEIPEAKAQYYGEVALMPDMRCDGYILQSGEAGMSENGASILLGIHRKAMYNVAANGLPTRLRQFLDKDEIMRIFPAKVEASNSPYFGRSITFYSVAALELLLRVYSRASINGALQKNQEHIGRRSVLVQTVLARSALNSLIRESCGLRPNVQKIIAKEFRKSLLSEETQILQSAIQVQYPKLDTKKQRALVAKGFKFGYEDALSSEEYKAIQGKGYPLHRQIESEETRQMVSQYLLLLACSMVSRESDIVEAREMARQIFRRLGDIRQEMKA